MNSLVRILQNIYYDEMQERKEHRTVTQLRMLWIKINIEIDKQTNHERTRRETERSGRSSRNKKIERDLRDDRWRQRD